MPAYCCLSLPLPQNLQQTRLTRASACHKSLLPHVLQGGSPHEIPFLATDGLLVSGVSPAGAGPGAGRGLDAGGIGAATAGDGSGLTQVHRCIAVRSPVPTLKCRCGTRSLTVAGHDASTMLAQP